jgi:hypothetical protein
MTTNSSKTVDELKELVTFLQTKTTVSKVELSSDDSLKLEFERGRDSMSNDPDYRIKDCIATVKALMSKHGNNISAKDVVDMLMRELNTKIAEQTDY